MNFTLKGERAMSRTIGPNDLRSAVNEILSDYQTEVSEATAKAVEETADDAKKKLRSAGSFKGTKYRKGWKVQLKKHRLYTEATVYNAKQPGLTHLLEFGHALARGGRKIGDVRAFEHIAPVNNAVPDDFEENLKEAIG